MRFWEPLSILIKYKKIDTPKIDNIKKKYISTFRLNYSHHQEMNDDDITYVQLYSEVIRYD